VLGRVKKYRRRVERTSSMRLVVPNETSPYDGSVVDRMHVSALPEWLMQGMDPPPGAIVRPEREGDAEDSDARTTPRRCRADLVGLLRS
jgi:hypothetical protein